MANTKNLTPVRKLESYQVIIRCMWERGPVQAEALAELERRGLYLSPEQWEVSQRVEPSIQVLPGFRITEV